MYTPKKANKTVITRNISAKGERIEEKVMRIKNNKEPVTDAVQMLYTERKDGVRPETDIRTDRWGIAIDAMDKVDKSHKANREQRIGESSYEKMNDEQKTKFNEKYPKNKHAIAEAAKKGDEGKA